jgi:hypothetical protein
MSPFRFHASKLTIFLNPGLAVGASSAGEAAPWRGGSKDELELGGVASKKTTKKPKTKKKGTQQSRCVPWRNLGQFGFRAWAEQSRAGRRAA